ncbi:MAG: hypothetical protein SFU98_22255 [Leptospiraceae bacterium]|nr:hypothetical protein [Leptospiraceae bacterium]
MKTKKNEFKVIQEFKDVESTWPRGKRIGLIKEKATDFRTRFKKTKPILAMKTVELISAVYPVEFAFCGAAWFSLNPFINIKNSVVIVQFEGFDRKRKTLVWEPTIPEGSAKAPFYANLLDTFGEFLSYKVFTKRFSTVKNAIESTGLKLSDIDYVSFDHLHVQDLRLLMGTVEPAYGSKDPIPALFPNAKFLFQEKEIDTLRSPHPHQWAWYVPGGLENVQTKNLVSLNGDVELGHGVALISTPGHTDGNHSLCINTPDGIWITSENGVSADNWHPEISKIPGLKRYAKFYNVEVVLNANTREDSIDQYDSMIKEKYIADENKKDPRFKNVFPSSELTSLLRHAPIFPTLTHGEINYGKIEVP